MGLKETAMQCQKCGHDVPDEKGRCMYCGAAVGDAGSIDSTDMQKKGVVETVTEESRRSVFTHGVSERDRTLNTLGNLPQKV